MAGIFSEQLEDGTIPEMKLDADAQLKLNTCGVTWETKTSHFQITATDNGKGYLNTGATGPVKGTVAAGLPDGFEVSFVKVAVQDFWFQPAADEECFYANRGSQTGWGLGYAVSLQPVVNRVTWKLVIDGGARMWVPIHDGQNLKAQTPLEGLDLKDKTPSGMEFPTNTPTCAVGRYAIRVKAGPAGALLGTLEWDAGFTWTDGVALVVTPDVLWLEIDTSLTHAGDSMVWSHDSVDQQNLSITYDGGGGFTTLTDVRPYEAPLTINRGVLVDFWIDMDGRLYERNGGATPFPGPPI